MYVPFIENIPPHFQKLFDDFNKKKHSHYWLEGGRASCKSSVIPICGIKHILTNPNAHILCARMYKSDLHKSVYSQMVRTINMLGLEKYFKFSDNPARTFPITFKPTGQKIYFEGLDCAESIKSLTPTFGAITFTWFEEIHQLQGMDKIRTAYQSVRRGSSDKFFIFYSYNPPRNKSNWVNEESKYIREEFLNNPNSDYYWSHSTYLDLPKYCIDNWIGSDFVKDAEFLKKKDIDAYNHEYLGIPTGYGTTVFKNLNVREITDEEIRTFDNICGSLDFGYAVDPLAYVRSHYDPRHKILYCIDEIYGTGLFNSDFAKLFKYNSSIPDRELIVADSAEPKSIQELVREYSLNVIGASKPKGSVESTTKYLQDLNEIVIDKDRCLNVYHEFMQAEFDTDKNGNVLPRLRKPDHAIDSLRYRISIEMQSKGGWNTEVIPKYQRGILDRNRVRAG